MENAQLSFVNDIVPIVKTHMNYKKVINELCNERGNLTKRYILRSNVNDVKDVEIRVGDTSRDIVEE